jgi:hypothetical protein
VSIASTSSSRWLAAAALFNPVRRRVQRAVGRGFNRARYDADQMVAGFAARWLPACSGSSCIRVGRAAGDRGGAVRVRQDLPRLGQEHRPGSSQPDVVGAAL